MFLVLIFLYLPLAISQQHGGGNPSGPQDPPDDQSEREFVTAQVDLIRLINNRRVKCFKNSWKVINLYELRTYIYLFTPKVTIPEIENSCNSPVFNYGRHEFDQSLECLFKDFEINKKLDSVIGDDYFPKYYKKHYQLNDEQIESLKLFYSEFLK